MTQETFTFQAEIKQLLDILVHSLYTEREIFLRELISNASDALNRVQFEMLTNPEVADADAELAIRITADEEAGTLTISDSGIGMTHDDLVNNLGVIARSGAKAFIEAMKDSKDNGPSALEVIGQFGVGFYSIFMVAEKVRVVSRSHNKDENPYTWVSDGSDNFTIEPAEREGRGTDVILYLKEDAKEFLKSWNIKQIIRRHSDYVAFPIYVGDDEEATNKRKALWRQQPSEVEEKEYVDFYKMLTMDFMGKPLHHIHMRADVPLQFYALLYIPSSSEPNMLSPRNEPGLKLYARKVLIQEHNTDLLPEYLHFIQGVVDSEDLPLNVSRESYQANTVMANLRKTLANKVLSELSRMARKKTEDYLPIFTEFARFIKQGVVVSPDDRERIMELLFFSTTLDDDPEKLHSLDAYVERMASNQDDIYYVMADDFQSARRSPHLDAFRQRGIEVLYFCDPVDSVMVMGLNDYKGHKFRNVDEADIDLSSIGEPKEDQAVPVKEALPDDAFGAVQARFESVLGERVKGVRAGKAMVGSAARLVSEDGSAARHMYRINRLLDKDYELPVKTLEINPRHPLLHNLSQMIQSGGDDTLIDAVVEQIFETALLQDGIHPDPAAMATRLTLLMQAATGSAVNELDFAEAYKVEVPQARPDPFASIAGMMDEMGEEDAADVADMPDTEDAAGEEADEDHTERVETEEK